jgi:hypothetical protein
MDSPLDRETQKWTGAAHLIDPLDDARVGDVRQREQAPEY